MKITKRELRKLIKEEGDKLIKESREPDAGELELEILEMLRDAEDGIPVDVIFDQLGFEYSEDDIGATIDHLITIKYAEEAQGVIYLGYMAPKARGPRMNESRLIKESADTESSLFEAMDNYIITLDEELGYEVPEDRLKDALLAQVDNYFKTVSQENADYWHSGK